MLQFYMNFWMRYRETLLDGAISADSPEEYYSQARARLGRREVVSVYTDPVVACTAAETVAVNVSPKKALYVKGAAGRRYRVVNCLGEGDREWDYFRAAAGNRCAHVRNPFYRRIKGAEKPGRTGSVPVLCPEGRSTELVMKLAVFGGGNPVSFFKQMREIMLIVVAKPQGDFPDGQIGVTQQILGRRYLF